MLQKCRSLFVRYCFAAGLGWAGTTLAADAPSFEVLPRQRVTYDGKVVATDQAKENGVDFGVIPTSPVALNPYYNVFTKMVETRMVPGVPHPIPVLRAPHVQLFAEKPDPARLAMDQVQAYSSQAELDPTLKYAVVNDGGETVRLITLTDITIPQDKTEQWRLRGSMESLKLVGHIDDPVADVGRAVLTTQPLPIKGRLIFGTRQQNWGPAELFSVDLPDGKRTKIADTTEPRIAVNGSFVDRVDMRNLRIVGPDGKVVGEIKLDPDEASEFNISPDGKKVAVSMERFVDVPNDLPRREMATLLFSVDGKKLGEVVGYDDPAFLPDGRLLLTGKGGEPGLFIADVASGKVTPLEIQDSAEKEPPFWPRMPSVSPDGKHVAFISRRSVFVVGIDGRGWAPVWTPGGDQEPQTAPTFSPDSSLIAVNIIPLNVMTGPGTVAVFDLKKHVRQPLESTKGADSEIPLVWQP